MRYYVQCCGSNYAAQGLALYRSMEKWCGEFHLTWVCADDELFCILSDQVDMPKCSLQNFSLVENCIDGLSDCRENRTEREWFWTLASQVTHWELERQKWPVTYLDSDLFFFSDDEPLYEELAQYGVYADTALFDHRFPEQSDSKWDRALYNVGWNYFNYTHKGRDCAQWWAERTREKCSLHMPEFPEWGIPPGRAGDQAYLEAFHTRCHVHVMRHERANWAPYNYTQYDVRRVTPIFFHFHEWESPDKRTGYHLTDDVIEYIYRPYEEAVSSAKEELSL